MTFPPPKFWKGEQQNYDDLLATADRSFTFCLSERSAKMLLAFTDPLHWNTRYFSEDGLDIDTDLIDKWASAVEEELIMGLNSMCGCIPVGALSRITGEGVLEISYDGGETWTPAPYLDPRVTSTKFPPLPEDTADKQCTGAENAEHQLAEFIDQLADVMDAGGTFTTLVGAAFAIVAIYLSGGALAPLIVPLMGAFVSAGASSIRAAFDATALEQFRCCVYCALDSDANLTSLDDLLACINEDMTGLAQTLTYAIVQIHGQIGITNWARTGSADGEGCDDCDCLECEAFDGGNPDNITNLVDFQVNPITHTQVGWAVDGGQWDGGNNYWLLGGCVTEPFIDIIFDHPVCINFVSGAYFHPSTLLKVTVGSYDVTDAYASANQTFNWTMPIGQITDKVRLTTDGSGSDCLGVRAITINYLEVP